MPAGRPKGYAKTGGRPKGSQNKATRLAREAISKFVDENADRLQSWLDQIAAGVPALDATGKVIPGQFTVKPDPSGAFEALMSVVEYHVPKLARTEHVCEGGGPGVIWATPTDEAL